MKYELCQTMTKDGLALQGLLAESQRKGRTAAVWIGGLTSRATNNPERTAALAKTFTAHGIAFAVWDTRGHSAVTWFRRHGRKAARGKYFLAGTAFERFEDSVRDIAAVISFLKKRGYRKIFLLGHSTGANKAAYYIQKKGGRGLAGIGLIAPISDIPGIRKKLGRRYERALRTAEKWFKEGKGDELLPRAVIGGDFYSARRFRSIATLGEHEDTFPYYGAKRAFPWTRYVRLPILTVLPGADLHADRPVTDILATFAKQIPKKYFSGRIIPRADHGFSGKKHTLALARTITNWILSSC